ncbi:MAG: rod shape-determining protein RodA [Bacteroidales bacterium]|nr:rod shape-determining protein RodA [Bacteroidales bacterium]
MARKVENILRNIDWHIVVIYVFLVFAGWLNIYSAVFDENASSIFDAGQKYGKQLIWIIAAFLLAIGILIFDSRFYFKFAYIFYFLIILSLVGVYLFAPEIKGARSWFEVGPLRVQPSEFAKLATSAVVARFMGRYDFKINRLSDIVKLGGLLALPGLLIVMQGDAGSALVFSAFFLVFYREGMPFTIILLGVYAILIFALSIIWGGLILSIIAVVLCYMAFFLYGMQKAHKISIVKMLLVPFAFVIPAVVYRYFHIDSSVVVIFVIGFVILFVPVAVYTYKKRVPTLLIIFGIALGSVFISQSVEYVFTNLLEAHQRTRINVFFGLESDPQGSEFNVIQSKIAIGSGDWMGKGFLNGTQTKNDFVPEQSTDFIFCTIGEEWGFLGSFVIIGLFVYLILRIMYDAEQQRTAFSRIYGYSVASILFFHVLINIGMTIGLMPVIGIPLPFFSYGGSSLWGFTLLLFIFVKLDANRTELIQ